MFLKEYRILLKFCSGGDNLHIVNTGMGNGLVPTWQQAITWTNDDPVHLMLISIMRPQWVDGKPVDQHEWSNQIKKKCQMTVYQQFIVSAKN